MTEQRRKMELGIDAYLERKAKEYEREQEENDEMEAQRLKDEEDYKGDWEYHCRKEEW